MEYMKIDNLWQPFRHPPNKNGDAFFEHTPFNIID